MHEFWRTVEPIVYEGRIKVPYSWQAGETASYFLTQLRDRQKIVGKKCPECQQVLAPPRKCCPFCFVHTTEWAELTGEGEVVAFTIVHRGTPLQPMKSPFAYAVIKLDGADTQLTHFIEYQDETRLKIGARARVLFQEERHGNIKDIKAFELIE
ncbi:MAG: OB-fold domain-containing protein [Proteobacteria bacterium]|nr:OB-fold domain-containing protein [Pseudomonadota bacterium]